MYGRNSLTNNLIAPTRVSADGSPKYKTGGATLDWSTVAQAGAGTSNVTLADGSVVTAGAKVLRYGQVLTKITASGKLGPYDDGASDGRQTLTRGNCYIADQTIIQYPGGAAGNSVVNDQVGGLIEGGEVWQDRILQSGTNTHSLNAGPTFAELATAFPTLTFAKD